MAKPVQFTYYGLNATYGGGSNHCGTSLTAPTNVNTTWGWNVGTLTPPRFCQMDQGVEVLRTSTEWVTTPTASAPNNTIGNCFQMGPFNGEFLSNPLIITMSVKATTSATGQDGFLVFRVWKSSDITGTTKASLVSNTYYSSSGVTNLTTTAVALTASLPLQNFSANGEYLFIHTQWGVIGAATNNNADIDFTFGSTANRIILPTFIGSPTTNINLIQEEYPY